MLCGSLSFSSWLLHVPPFYSFLFVLGFLWKYFLSPPAHNYRLNVPSQFVLLSPSQVFAFSLHAFTLFCLQLLVTIAPTWCVANGRRDFVCGRGKQKKTPAKQSGLKNSTATVASLLLTAAARCDEATSSRALAARHPAAGRPQHDQRYHWQQNGRRWVNW